MPQSPDSRSVSPPSQELLKEVRAAFVARGSSLHAWAIEHDVKWPNARAALLGAWDGPKARQLRKRIIAAAGLTARAA
jgi:hypothetical protein